MTTTDDMTIRTGDSCAADPFDACLSSLGAALAGTVDTPVWMLSEQAVQERLTQALRVRGQVEELTARLLASVQAREIPRVAGASSTRAWLMATRGLSAQDAARLVKETAVFGSSEDLAEPRSAATRSAWATGQVSTEQSVLIAGTVDKLGTGVQQTAVDRLQTDLVHYAQTLSWTELQHVCSHAVEVVDPGAADAVLANALQTEEERALALCELKFRRSGDGWTGFAGRLPDVQADMWKKALDSITAPRHECAVPSSPSDPIQGGRPPHADDPVAGPSYPQRLGRAFLELIEHLPTDGLPQHGTNPASVIVTMTLDQLLRDAGEAMLDSGTALSPAQCRRLACNANLLPMVLGGDSAILDLGLGHRLFDRYQRLALAVRDGGCVWPGCERPPGWTEAHHVVPWALGGPTDLTNGCLLCPFHHHLVHSSAGWQIQVAADGIPELVPPERLDPQRQPRRHERFQRHRC